MKEKLQNLFIKVGFLLIAFDVLIIIFSIVIWLNQPKEMKGLWLGFLTGFPLPILLSVNVAVGVNKMISKFTNRKGDKKSGK